MKRIVFAWEIGARHGHVGPLLPLAARLAQAGYDVEAYLRDPEAAASFSGADAIHIHPAPRWVGPVQQAEGLNYAEILLNFGFHSADALAQLVDAWRERLARADLLVSNVAPAALIAARTLGLPALEVSQGFHVPPPGFPSPPFRDWEPAPRARLTASDSRVLQAINPLLAHYGLETLASLGELFAGRTLLQTYPELEMYPERGLAEYFGIVPVVGGPRIEWPAGRPRTLAYVYADYKHLDALLDALARSDGAGIVVCAGLDEPRKHAHASQRLVFSDALVDFQAMAESADVVVCHGSHQTTAEALLVGRPLLLLPTQLEQFLTTRRVVRYGAGLGILQEAAEPDFSTALATLLRDDRFAQHAENFAARYRAHRRDTALASLVARCEAELSRAVRATP